MCKSLPAMAALCLFLAGCAGDTERRAAEARLQENAQAAAIAQQDDARCQSFARPGSDAYVKCRASLASHRTEMNAIIRGPDGPTPGSGSK